MKKIISVFIVFALLFLPVKAHDNDNVVNKQNNFKSMAALVIWIVLGLVAANEANIVPPYSNGYSHGK